MGRLLFNAVKNTIVICFGMGVISLGLLIIFTFLMNGNMLGAIGLVMLIVFVVCLWNTYSEREEI